MLNSWIRLIALITINCCLVILNPQKSSSIEIHSFWGPVVRVFNVGGMGHTIHIYSYTHFCMTVAYTCKCLQRVHCKWHLMVFSKNKWNVRRWIERLLGPNTLTTCCFELIKPQTPHKSPPQSQQWAFTKEQSRVEEPPATLIRSTRNTGWEMVFTSELLRPLLSLLLCQVCPRSYWCRVYQFTPSQKPSADGLYVCPRW